MSQQGLRQAAIRAVTGTALTHNGDWLALFDALAIPAGTFNGRMLAYINTYLGTSYTEINGAMAAFAASQSADNFQGMGSFTPFSPKFLFASGEQGVWYDPSDFSTMFQDVAGTTPVTAVEQPVGLILDKSGRGNHASQSTAASRPVLKQDANGKYYLLFDGVDDSLATGTITPGTDKVQVFAGVRKLSDAAIGIFAELSASHLANAGTFTLLPNSSTVGALGNRFAFASRGSAAAATSQLAYSNSAPAPTTQVWVSTGDISGDLNSIRLNGAASGVVATGDQGTGNYLSYPLYIGRRGGTSLPFNGQLYSLIARFGANLSAATITQTETWVNGKTGAY